MRIHSDPSYIDIPGEVFYDVNLPQLGKDFWQPLRETLEAAYLPTASAPAGVFKQINRYDVSSIKKEYLIIVTDAQAATLQAMSESEQDTFIVDTGNGRYSCSVVSKLAYRDGKPEARLTFSVVEAA